MKDLTDKLGKLFSHLAPSPKTPALGERELEVMKIVWQDSELSAKQVLERITDSALSLSTMQSTLERLYRKELLHRKKTGRYFVYTAAVSRTQIISQLLGDITEQICDGDMAPLVSGFSNFYRQQTPNDKRPEASEPDVDSLTSTNDQSRT